MFKPTILKAPGMAALAAALALAGLTACGDRKAASKANKANFKQAIQARIDAENGRPACIRLRSQGVPQAEGDEDAITIAQGPLHERQLAQADALVQAGLLTRAETAVKPRFGQQMVPAYLYTLSSEGRQYRVADDARRSAFSGHAIQLCTGKTVVDEVGVFTEPTDAGGRKLSQVKYTARLKDVAAWAQRAEVQKVFPELARRLDDRPAAREHRAVLVLTSEGWMDAKSL